MNSYQVYQKVGRWIHMHLEGFALFQAGQESELQPAIVKPEGRIFFAGDHTTLYHGWIQGAIESGVRVAVDVNELNV